MYITNQRYFVFILFIFLLVFSMNDITDALPVCDRTPQVRDGIVAAAGVAGCADVTDAHLAAIITLNLKSKGIETLKDGDFDGLSALKFLNLSSNDLSSLPSGILDNLTTLKGLYLGSNDLSSLPSGIFNNQTALTSLYLSSNDLSSLPLGIFDNLTALTDLSLGSNELLSLPENIFDNLTVLITLSLGSNQLSSLPSGIFDNLTALTTLYLGSNQLSSLPSGIFSNLTALEKLYLNNNEVSPLPLTVSLEKVAEGQFKATAPTGAPFEIVLPLTITNGSISGGASNIIISAGSVESPSLTVSRTTGTTAAVTVDIGTLPGRPTGHGGYALVKSTGLPLEVFGSININNALVFTDGTTTTRSVAENTPSNENIGSAVSATDQENDTLTYSLSGTDAASFDIVSTSGQLKTKDALDYETKNFYEVEVSVSDGSGGTVSITVTIEVTDETENQQPTLLSTLSAPGQIGFSELMFASKGGLHSLPQWIELYNNSDTEAVNLRGWKLQIEARDANGKHRYAVIPLEEVHIPASQTVLIVTWVGHNSGNFPEDRVYNFFGHHSNQFEQNQHRNMLLGLSGFYLKLSDPDDVVSDETGNLDGDVATEDKPEWEIPAVTTEDHARTSLMRRYDIETSAPFDGTALNNWRRAADFELLVSRYWGSTTDIGNPGYRSGTPLPVTLSAFSAEVAATGVVIKWTTESELENAGFNILRGQTKNGTFKVVNRILIQGAGTTGERNTYTWTDTTAKPNVVYYYGIEDVSHAGVRKQLTTVRLKGLISASGKLTTSWGDLKMLQ